MTAPENLFGHLKVGDKVTRLLGEQVKMPMVVVKVRSGTILCGAPQGDGSIFAGGWEFDKRTGAEEDAALGWGIGFGRTGSRLIRDEEEK